MKTGWYAFATYGYTEYNVRKGNNMSAEQILVVPTKIISTHIGLGDNWQHIMLSAWLKHALFMDRDAAEIDENFKQFIPYCFLRDNQGKYFAYKRTPKGGEKRLHGLWSCGVGGHLNLIDGNGGWEIYNNGLKRELEEEVGLKEGQYAHKIQGFINDDSSPVNRVHIGIIHIVDVNSNAIEQMVFKDKALSNGGWETLDNLKKNVGQFESWSEIVINSGVLS